MYPNGVALPPNVADLPPQLVTSARGSGFLMRPSPPNW